MTLFPPNFLRREDRPEKTKKFLKLECAKRVVKKRNNTTTTRNDDQDDSLEKEAICFCVCAKAESRRRNFIYISAPLSPFLQNGIKCAESRDAKWQNCHLETFLCSLQNCIFGMKNLIQHCERSELRLHFEWTLIKNAKNGPF